MTILLKKKTKHIHFLTLGGGTKWKMTLVRECVRGKSAKRLLLQTMPLIHDMTLKVIWLLCLKSFNKMSMMARSLLRVENTGAFENLMKALNLLPNILCTIFPYLSPWGPNANYMSRSLNEIISRLPSSPLCPEWSWLCLITHSVPSSR